MHQVLSEMVLREEGALHLTLSDWDVPNWIICFRNYMVTLLCLQKALRVRTVSIRERGESLQLGYKAAGLRHLPDEADTWNKGKGSPSHHVAYSASPLEVLNHYNHHMFLMMMTTVMMIGFRACYSYSSSIYYSYQ